MPVARVVRQGGVSAELGYGARKLPRELERANKLGVAYAVIAGENELAAGEAVLREMKTGEQRRVPIAALAAQLCALAAKSASPKDASPKDASPKDASPKDASQ
jgi:histidyl-tRNA synthetase